jgi:hypothetical protein
MKTQEQWEDIQRIESFAGEVRGNLIRLAALLVFYGHHLLNVYLFRDDPGLTEAYHTSVTALVVTWALAVVVVHVCLARRWMPPALKYVVTVWDLLLITLLLMLGGDPHSTLAVLYFLVIVGAALRLSLPLVYMATLGAMAAYLVFLGYVRFWLELPETQRLARPQQVVFLLALGAAGILIGQVVRQVRRVALGNPVQVVEESGEGSAAQGK